MKKIFLLLIFIIAFILPVWLFAECNIWSDFNWSVWSALDTCLSDSNLVDWSNWTIEVWLKNLINNWVKNIWSVLWLLAVWFIVYWSLLLTLSAWEDEKIKKAKDVIKWSIIGFLWVIFASSIVLLVVNVMYSIEVF